MLIGLSVLLTVLLMLVFTTLGTSDTSFAGVVGAITGALSAGGEITDKQDKIIMLLRLPRMAMAVVAGWSFRIRYHAGGYPNPLVSPFTIGISNAAAFGASLSIVFGIGLFSGSQLGTVFNAFLWALGCMGVVSLIAAKAGMSPSTIVLTGIALNYLFSACTSTIEFFASEHKLAEVVQWAFGSLNGSDWQEVFVMAVVVAVCTTAMFFHAPALNIIAGGDDEVAKSLGIHPGNVRFAVCVEAAMATAAVISFTGVIGFVGLAGLTLPALLLGAITDTCSLFSGHGSTSYACGGHNRTSDTGSGYDPGRNCHIVPWSSDLCQFDSGAEKGECINGAMRGKPFLLLRQKKDSLIR